MCPDDSSEAACDTFKPSTASTDSIRPLFLFCDIDLVRDSFLFPSSRVKRRHSLAPAFFTTWSHSSVDVPLRGPLPICAALDVGAGLGADHYVL